MDTIDFEKYGTPVAKTNTGTTVDFSKYGSPISTPEDSVDQPFKFNVQESQQQKISRLQEEARKSVEEAKKANSFTEKYVRPVADSLLPGAANLGDTVGGIINTQTQTKQYTDAIQSVSDNQVMLIKKINQNKALGKPTANLEQLYNEGVDRLSALQGEYKGLTAGAQKTTKQVAGELGSTALNLLLAGSYGKVTAGMNSFRLGSELPSAVSKITGLITKPAGLFTKKGMADVALGAGIGEAFDIGQNLMDNKEGTDILTEGYGKYIGGLIPTLTGASKSVVNKLSSGVAREELGNAFRKVAGQYTKSSAILERAETINKTDPIGVLQMYGGKTVPEMTPNGRVNPAEQVDFLWGKIKELSELKNDAVFASDNVLTMDEFVKYTNDIIDGQSSWTKGKKLTEKNQVQKILDEIKAGQGDNPIEMAELDRIKTEQTGLSKTYKNPNVKFTYDSHSVVGKSARDLVELFTDDQSVRDMNKLIQSHYDAIDLLSSWRGLTPKGGIMSKNLSRIGGQIIGYGIGSSAGHPYAGPVLGGMIADRLSSISQSNFISNPIKKFLIGNLQKEIPLQETALRKSLDQKYSQLFDDLGLPSLSGKSESPNIALKNGISKNESLGGSNLNGVENNLGNKTNATINKNKPIFGNDIVSKNKNQPGYPQVPDEAYIKSGLKQGKSMSQIMIDFSKGLPALAPFIPLPKANQTPSGTNLNEVPPQWQVHINEVYKKYPGIQKYKGLIEAILMQESSMGANDKNYNKTTGESAWIGGFTDIAKKELDRNKIPYELDSQKGLIDAIGAYLNLKKVVTDTKGKSKEYESPINLYLQRYKTSDGHKLTKEQIAQFEEYVNYYKNL